VTTRACRDVWRRRLALSLVVWGALALLAWLDTTTSHLPAQQAHVWQWIVGAATAIWAGLSVAGAAIAATAIAAIGYLGAAVAWIAVHLAGFIVSSGAMFARVWESARRFYSGVLRPALVWLHDWYARARAWLRKYFGPVFRFLDRVRQELRRIYTRFVRPILDIIAVTRAVMRVLITLHVPFARALDQVLDKTEQVIDENVRRALLKVNKLLDLVDSVITFDGLFQRVPFLRSIERDVRYVFSALHRSRSTPLSDREWATLAERNAPPTRRELGAAFEQFLVRGEGPLAERYASADLSDTIFAPTK
jgi:hypothetical protein